MATFYSDSGSFRNLSVTGSTVMSASTGPVLQLKGSGSIIFSISGSGGEIFNISDTGTSTLFNISSGSINLLNISNAKIINISSSMVITGSLTINGNIIPGGPYTANTSSYSLGSPTAAWKDLYVSNGSVIFLSGSTSSSISLGPSGEVSLTGSLQGTASYAATASAAPNYIAISTSGTSQTISGSLVINQNLTVLGTQSVQYITSSQLNISTNLITLNTNTPGVRFGGLAVADSGSSPIVSGSLLFDSQQDQWIFVHNTAPVITSSVLIMGPETYGNIGNETNLTNNRIPKSVNAEHIGDSNISDTGTTVSINSNTQITGSLNISGVITGSLAGTASWATNFVSASNYVLNNQTSSFATTGSNNFIGNQTITGSLVVTGSTFLTARISGSVAANNPSSSILNIGGTIVSPTGITGSSAILATPIISASANNQTLVGLDINPIIVTGSFTGLSALAGKFNGNVLMGQVPAFLSAYTYVPLTLCNSLAAGLKTQLALVNSGGGSGAGSAIDFFTYTDQGNGNPAARIAGVDDGNFSNNLQILTKATGSSGAGALTTKVQLFGGTGNLFVGTSPSDGGFKLDVNGTARIQSTLTVSAGGSFNGQVNFNGGYFTNGLVSHGTQIVAGANVNAAVTYKTTNAGGTITPMLAMDRQSGTAGQFTHYFDTTNGFTLGAFNSSAVSIARAAISITNLTNTAGAETGDLIFLTQNSGNAMAERVRILASGFMRIPTGAITQGLMVGSNAAANTYNAFRTTSGGTQLIPGVQTYSSGTTGQRAYILDGGESSSNGNNGFVLAAWNSSSTLIARAGINITNLTNTASAESGDLIFLTQSGGTAMSEKMRITGAGGLTLNATNTATGTTGNQTINKASGTVNIAAAGTTVTVTNSLVTASSIVFAVIRTDDATATIKNVVPAAGSFVINLGAATTAETSIGFFVIN
jgi:hypothetical protein